MDLLKKKLDGYNKLKGKLCFFWNDDGLKIVQLFEKAQYHAGVSGGIVFIPEISAWQGPLYYTNCRKLTIDEALALVTG